MSCRPNRGGLSKTTIAAHIIASAVSRGGVLMVAHRRELIGQASARLDEHGLQDHGILMADHPRRRPNAPIQVASIQTLARREMPPAPRLVIIDECHHAAANSYKRLYRAYPDAWFLGLTATPWRQDGRGLVGLFDGVVVVSTPKELIAEGFLCSYQGYKYISPNVSRVRTVAGDYEQGGLALACSEPKVLGDIVHEWLLHANNAQTVAFAVNIDHAEMLAKAFCSKGVAAETIDHRMPNYERDAVLARVRSGQTRVIVNVGILGEGVDIPALECAILARPTKSLALYLQQVGRVLRPFPGKAFARIHDHAGNVDRHGLPCAWRDYSLSADRKKNTAKLSPITTCPACFAMFEMPEDGLCPVCGHELVKAREAKNTTMAGDGVAVDIRLEQQLQASLDSLKEMKEFREKLVRTCLERGYAAGFLVHRWKEKYPNAPIPWGAFQEVKRKRALRAV